MVPVNSLEIGKEIGIGLLIIGMYSACGCETDDKRCGLLNPVLTLSGRLPSPIGLPHASFPTT